MKIVDGDFVNRGICLHRDESLGMHVHVVSEQLELIFRECQPSMDHLVRNL